ncbi:MAG: S9 family peptidase, partial [Gammaproteobacteria bacterium]|nr:S9 family peptidase [Gammaproteobacteria bacterium]
MKKLHLLLVLCLLPVMAWAQDDTSLSVERLWQLERIGNPVASSNGRYIVAPVTKYDVKADKGHTRLWLFSADGKQQTALTA